MEQAQLIAIPGTNMAERRNSLSNSEGKSISWETPSRLATVNEWYVPYYFTTDIASSICSNLIREQSIRKMSTVHTKKN